MKIFHNYNTCLLIKGKISIFKKLKPLRAHEAFVGVYMWAPLKNYLIFYFDVNITPLLLTVYINGNETKLLILKIETKILIFKIGGNLLWWCLKGWLRFKKDHL